MIGRKRVRRKVIRNRFWIGEIFVFSWIGYRD